MQRAPLGGDVKPWPPLGPTVQVEIEKWNERIVIGDDGAAKTQPVDDRDRRALARIRDVILVRDTDDENARIAHGF